jgi:hypothetical protein
MGGTRKMPGKRLILLTIAALLLVAGTAGSAWPADGTPPTRLWQAFPLNPSGGHTVKPTSPAKSPPAAAAPFRPPATTSSTASTPAKSKPATPLPTDAQAAATTNSGGAFPFYLLGTGLLIALGLAGGAFVFIPNRNGRSGARRGSRSWTAFLAGTHRSSQVTARRSSRTPPRTGSSLPPRFAGQNDLEPGQPEPDAKLPTRPTARKPSRNHTTAHRRKTRKQRRRRR